jgi:hypothetical protein
MSQTSVGLVKLTDWCHVVRVVMSAADAHFPPNFQPHFSKTIKSDRQHEASSTKAEGRGQILPLSFSDYFPKIGIAKIPQTPNAQVAFP